MSKAPFIDWDNTIKSFKNNKNFELGTTRLALRRVRQIENILGTRITSAPEEILESEISEKLTLHDQTTQLLYAFGLIKDTKVRADILSMVLAAAQHEGGLD